jgi:hypothetical protein
LHSTQFLSIFFNFCLILGIQYSHLISLSIFNPLRCMLSVLCRSHTISFVTWWSGGSSIKGNIFWCENIASCLPTHLTNKFVLSNMGLNFSKLLILTIFPLFRASYRLGYF